MIHYLAEDPWPATIACGIVAAVCLIALRVTQQGKFLIAAIIAVVLAAVVWGIDSVWVTDAERVEAVAYGLARAVRDANPPPDPDAPKTSPPPARSDEVNLDQVFAFLAPDVTLEMGERALPTPMTQGSLRMALRRTSFDFVKVSRMDVSVAKQARTAKARFRVHAGGSTGGGASRLNFLTDPQGTDWELGLRETAPGTWKVTRITPLRLPRGVSIPGL